MDQCGLYNFTITSTIVSLNASIPSEIKQRPMISNEQPKSQLLCLPPELRDMIFNFVIVLTMAVNISKPPFRYPMGLLGTCSELREYLLPTFFRRNAFEYSFHNQSFHHIEPFPLRWLKMIGPYAASHINDFCIGWTGDDPLPVIAPQRRSPSIPITKAIHLEMLRHFQQWIQYDLPLPSLKFLQSPQCCPSFRSGICCHHDPRAWKKFFGSMLEQLADEETRDGIISRSLQICGSEEWLSKYWWDKALRSEFVYADRRVNMVRLAQEYGEETEGESIREEDASECNAPED